MYNTKTTQKFLQTKLDQRNIPKLIPVILLITEMSIKLINISLFLI